jgi:hypothetical protein
MSAAVVITRVDHTPGQLRALAVKSEEPSQTGDCWRSHWSRRGARGSLPREPGDRSFDDPAFWQHHKLARIGPFHYLHVDLLAGPLQAALELWALVAAVGIELQQKWKQAEQRAHQRHTAVAILISAAWTLACSNMP